jgi:hypothetical protein
MFKTGSLFIVFIMLFNGTLKIQAQDFATENNLNFKIKGNHDLYFHFPLNNEGRFQYPLTSPKSINNFELKIADKHIKVVSGWELRSIIPESGQQNETTRLIPKENYVRYSTNKLNLTFGLQKYAWGMADMVNPTNNLNPLDYTITGFEPEQIPVFSLSMEYFPNDKWKIQAVYIPFDQSDNIFWSYSEAVPEALFSKYIISDFDFNTQTPIPEFLPQSKSISELNPEYGLNSGIYACRLNLYSSKIDLSLSYIYDFDSYYTPQITTEKYSPGITTTLEDRINQRMPVNDAAQLIDYLSNISSYTISNIDLSRKRIHRLGVNAKTTIGRFGLWLEACYSITEQKNTHDYQNRGNDLFFVAGTDFFFGPNDRFYANIQYTGKWIPNYYHSFYSDYPNGLPKPEYQSNKEYMQEYYNRTLVQPLGFQNEIWQHGISVKFDYSFFNGKLKPSFVGYIQIPTGYDTAEKSRMGSLLVMPSIDYSTGNALHFILGSYLSYSAYKNAGSNRTKYNDNASILGLLNAYNNLFLKIAYSWSQKK